MRLVVPSSAKAFAPLSQNSATVLFPSGSGHAQDWQSIPPSWLRFNRARVPRTMPILLNAWLIVSPIAFSPAAVLSGFETLRSCSLLPILFGADPLIAGVNVEPLITNKSDECHSKFGRKLDRKTRRRSDGGENRNSRHQRLLHKLKTRAAAHKQYFVRQGQFAGEKFGSDDLVESIVTSDIFANDVELASYIE